MSFIHKNGITATINFNSYQKKIHTTLKFSVNTKKINLICNRLTFVLLLNQIFEKRFPGTIAFQWKWNRKPLII